MKIRKGDQIYITTGKDRGKRGTVTRTLPSGNKVVVEGLNLVKRHKRPKRQGERGQRVEVPSPLAVANVRLVCKSCGKPARVGYRLEGKNKVRICKKCDAAVS